MSIEARSIHKRFGRFVALDNVSLKVETGKLVALLGPSGSGKTTLLRVIAGLDFSDSSESRVLFDGEDVTDRRASERKAGFAFQHYALFRHLSVFENIAFGLRVRPRASRPSEQQIRDRVRELLQLIQLEPLADRFPSQLSGGQRQRVSLARALAVEPKVLLLDEPFGALDAQVRKELRRWLRRLHDDLHITSIFVTHDQEEALEVADQVVVMNKGRIEQLGTPKELYDQPANPFVLEFLGHVNLFRGRVSQGRVSTGDTEFLTRRAITPGPLDEGLASVYFRPHDVDLILTPNGAPNVPALIRHINAAGPTVRVELERLQDGSRFEVDLPRDRWDQINLPVSSRVYVTLKKVHLFSGSSPIGLDADSKTIGVPLAVADLIS